MQHMFDATAATGREPTATSCPCLPVCPPGRLTRGQRAYADPKAKDYVLSQWSEQWQGWDGFFRGTSEKLTVTEPTLWSRETCFCSRGRLIPREAIEMRHFSYGDSEVRPGTSACHHASMPQHHNTIVRQCQCARVPCIIRGAERCRCCCDVAAALLAMLSVCVRSSEGNTCSSAHAQRSVNVCAVPPGRLCPQAQAATHVTPLSSTVHVKVKFSCAQGRKFEMAYIQYYDEGYMPMEVTLKTAATLRPTEVLLGAGVWLSWCALKPGKACLPCTHAAAQVQNVLRDMNTAVHCRAWVVEVCYADAPACACRRPKDCVEWKHGGGPQGQQGKIGEPNAHCPSIHHICDWLKPPKPGAARRAQPYRIVWLGATPVSKGGARVDVIPSGHFLDVPARCKLPKAAWIDRSAMLDVIEPDRSKQARLWWGNVNGNPQPHLHEEANHAFNVALLATLEEHRGERQPRAYRFLRSRMRNAGRMLRALERDAGRALQARGAHR
jgi:hypothetical protein